jgi:hypothetical protein
MSTLSPATLAVVRCLAKMVYEDLRATQRAAYAGRVPASAADVQRPVGKGRPAMNAQMIGAPRGDMLTLRPSEKPLDGAVDKHMVGPPTDSLAAAL